MVQIFIYLYEALRYENKNCKNFAEKSSCDMWKQWCSQKKLLVGHRWVVLKPGTEESFFVAETKVGPISVYM